MYELILQSGAHHAISRDVTTLGRESCDILISGEAVSRCHAQITRQGEQLFLTDRNSTNGTYLNGVKVAGASLLHPGDQIRIGSAVFTLVVKFQQGKTQAIADEPYWEPQSSALPSSTPNSSPSGGSAGPASSAPNIYFPPPSQPQFAAPPKDKTLAIVLEFLLLGLGWIYAGEQSTGILILIGWMVFGLIFGVTLDLATGGAACLCTVPLGLLAYVFSLTQLSTYMRSHPERFQ